MTKLHADLAGAGAIMVEIEGLTALASLRQAPGRDAGSPQADSNARAASAVRESASRLTLIDSMEGPDRAR